VDGGWTAIAVLTNGTSYAHNPKTTAKCRRTCTHWNLAGVNTDGRSYQDLFAKPPRHELRNCRGRATSLRGCPVRVFSRRFMERPRMSGAQWVRPGPPRKFERTPLELLRILLKSLAKYTGLELSRCEHVGWCHSSYLPWARPTRTPHGGRVAPPALDSSHKAIQITVLDDWDPSQERHTHWVALLISAARLLVDLIQQVVITAGASAFMALGGLVSCRRLWSACFSRRYVLKVSASPPWRAEYECRMGRTIAPIRTRSASEPAMMHD
jgi:hypothetical protein